MYIQQCMLICMSISCVLLTFFGYKYITVFQTNLMEYHPQLGAFYPPCLILHGEQFRYGFLLLDATTLPW